MVDGFAIPIVAHAIAVTMGLPGDTARLVSWGLHVFTDPATGERRANAELDEYLAERVDAALGEPGDGNVDDDIFGDLARADFDGRRLTRDELLGYGYLVLAGGRDTVIASIAGGAVAPRHAPRGDRRAGATTRPASPPPSRSTCGTSPRSRTSGAPSPSTASSTGTTSRPASWCRCASPPPTATPACSTRPSECLIDRIAEPPRRVRARPAHVPRRAARPDGAGGGDRALPRRRRPTCEVITPDTWEPRDLDTVTTGSSFPHDLRLRIA